MHLEGMGQSQGCRGGDDEAGEGECSCWRCWSRGDGEGGRAD